MESFSKAKRPNNLLILHNICFVILSYITSLFGKTHLPIELKLSKGQYLPSFCSIDNILPFEFVTHLQFDQ